MNRIIIICLVLVCFNCKNQTKSTIQKEFLISDWITSDSFFSDSLRLTIEDSTIFSGIFGDYEIVYKYSLSNDTLLLRPLFTNHKKQYLEKFKILKLSNNQLIIKYIDNQFSMKHEDIIPIKASKQFIFFKYDTSKNNKTIKKLTTVRQKDSS